MPFQEPVKHMEPFHLPALIASTALTKRLQSGLPRSAVAEALAQVEEAPKQPPCSAALISQLDSCLQARWWLQNSWRTEEEGNPAQGSFAQGRLLSFEPKIAAAVGLKASSSPSIFKLSWIKPWLC